GYEDPGASLAVLEEFRKDRKFVVLAAQSRRRLDLFMPKLLDAVSKSDRPSLCLTRIMPLIEAVCRRTAYLVLLMENPGALQQLVIYCKASPLISEYLSKFPVLLDELLEVLDVPPDKSVLADELRMQLLRIDENSFEEQLECLRYFKQAHLLQVAAADVSGKMPLMKVSDYLTFTAEVILETVLSLAWQNMVSRHGYPLHTDGSFGKPEFAIIGYGKLGGLELSYNSDLDLVFLHRANLEADTVTDMDSQQSINSRAFYIKLAQRIMVILGTYTMSGKLYDVDIRLRPSGESGMLVSSLESFAEYQQSSAWTWEHQALVRARGVAGNMELIAAFGEVRRKVLSAKRDTGKVAEEVVAMRKRMRGELASSSSLKEEKLAFELKQGSGGIVDIEFLVQFLVLAHSCHCAGLMTYTDNYRILEAAMKCELLVPDDMQILINAYLELRAASHQLALHQYDALSSVQRLNCQANVTQIWNSMFDKLVDA
ncbi:MAG: bifunctional [glutamate--ammonia ligase]-adenylyl-L-tyrosine phosphorylase/[glutamate--ammonia-ligase] adenylyltransferase, partial [Pseudohongiellaceae bacterium]